MNIISELRYYQPKFLLKEAYLIFIQIQIVNIVLTLGNNILLLEPDSVVERLEVLLRYDVVGVEVEDVVEEVPELVLLEG